MRTPAEIASFAVVLAERATDELTEFIGPLDDSDEHEDLLREAGRAVPLDAGPRRTPATRQTWEGHAARNFLMAVEDVLRTDDRSDADEDFEEDGWEALRDGDLVATRAAAHRMLEQATQLEDGHWDYGNQIHWAHILLGQAHLRADNIRGAEEELHAAAATPGSPQLNSFGPDLCLAWRLLELGSGTAALQYFQQVSRFWSPSRRRP